MRHEARVKSITFTDTLQCTHCAISMCKYDLIAPVSKQGGGAGHRVGSPDAGPLSPPHQGPPLRLQPGLPLRRLDCDHEAAVYVMPGGNVISVQFMPNYRDE